MRRKITRKKDITSLWNLIMSDHDIREVKAFVKDLEFLMDFGRVNFTEFVREEVKWVRMDIDITLASYDEEKGLLVPAVTKKSLDKVEEDRFKDQLKGRHTAVLLKRVLGLSLEIIGKDISLKKKKTFKVGREK